MVNISTVNVLAERNNFLKGHGVSIGSETSGWVRNITIRDSQVRASATRNYMIPPMVNDISFTFHMSHVTCHMSHFTVHVQNECVARLMYMYTAHEMTIFTVPLTPPHTVTSYHRVAHRYSH